MDQVSSLSTKLLKSILVTVVISMGLILIAVIQFVFFSSYNVYDNQIKTLTSLIPDYSLPRLQDSDYFTITGEVKFLQSTNLFSEFVITDNLKRPIAQFPEENEKKDIKLHYIPIKDKANVVWGYFSYKTNFYRFFLPIVNACLACLLLMLAVFSFVRWRLKQNLTKEFNNFSTFLENIEKLTKRIEKFDDVSAERLLIEQPYSEEQRKINNVISRLVKEISSSHKRLGSAIKEAEQQRLRSELSKVAVQVAHDIRSPLAALEMGLQTASTLPEQQRILIRNAISRISDIANNILEKHRLYASSNENSSYSEVDKNLKSVEFVCSLISEIVTEKRLQFATYKNIQIDYNIDPSGYSLFALINRREFKSLLSNIVNNGVEAITRKGSVTIYLNENKSFIEIIVEDTGKGIPKDVLEQLGNNPKSFGKKDGTGLGVYHAKRTIEAWDGVFTISSEVGKGTCVILQLPKNSPPIWFMPEIKLPTNKPIVILDDDPSIHEVWKSRIGMLEGGQNIKLDNFKSTQQLKLWADMNPYLVKQALYLCDYELLGSTENGLQVIKSLDICQQSILVTSLFEDSYIRKECETHGIKLLPKLIAGFIPLSVVDNKLIDAILIDDDELVHMTWNLSAKTYGKTLKTYFTLDEFYNELHAVDKDVAIYVDANLRDNVRGEEVAKDLYALGFQNLYITTGLDKSGFKEINFIKGILGKESPWNSIHLH